MLKKTIKFQSFDGEELEEDFYFNLSSAELAELQLIHPGGFAEYLQDIIKASDGKSIIETFKRILKLAYGKRSPDGRRFMKSDEIWNDFYETDAYNRLFMEIVTDANAAAEFVRGLVPADLSEKVAQTQTVKDVQLPMDVPGAPENQDLSKLSQGELIDIINQRSKDKQLPSNG